MRFANLICGEPHPDFVLERLTPQQYHEIKTHYATDLLPDERLALESAFSRFVVARAGGAKGLKLDDFILKLATDAAKPEPEQDQDEMNRQMMKVAAAFAAAQRINGKKKLPPPKKA